MIQDHPLFALQPGRHPALLDPWSAALDFGPGTVMAVLTRTEGPAYRNPGAAMAIAADGRTAGTLTSGCIEADLVLQAVAVRHGGLPKRLHYGRGSPFIDLTLPCGGAIEVTLFPIGEISVLKELARRRAARQITSLALSDTGHLALDDASGLRLMFRPPLRFAIFGVGAEAVVFANLVRALAFDHVLVSHDDRSLDMALRMGCATHGLRRVEDIAALVPDSRCAALLFYHDHDREPALLRQLLAGPAFYIGAQGSRAAQARRMERLADMGVPAAECSRLRGPIGMIRSTRDPQQLAVSVLAEVMSAMPASVDLWRG